MRINMHVSTYSRRRVKPTFPNPHSEYGRYGGMDKYHSFAENREDRIPSAFPHETRRGAENVSGEEKAIPLLI